MYGRVTTIDQAGLVQGSINNAVKWAEDWQMFFNIVSVNIYILETGGYKVRKEPSLTKRCEKMRKEPSFMRKQALLYRNKVFFKEGINKT